MSIRAYRVIKRAETAKENSFNAWNDEAIMDFILAHGDTIDQRNEEGAGVLEVSIECLEELVKTLTAKEDTYQRKAILADIAIEKKAGNTHVDYELF